MNTSAFGVEKGVLIRVPATANLMIDSADRNSVVDVSGLNISSPWDFNFFRKQSLANGFFQRIGTTEVVLEWNVQNIRADLSNNWMTIKELSGNNVLTVALNDGFYTASQALESLASALNAVSPSYNYSITTSTETDKPIFGIDNTPAGRFKVYPGYLAQALNFNQNPYNPQQPSTSQIALSTPYFRLITVQGVDLRPYRYLDFICDELSSVQDVKDASTAPIVRDVLCRWYFADDAPNTYDNLGIPILMGYTPFKQRRIFNPPKQIKWEQNKPLGGYLNFKVYGTDVYGNSGIVREAARVYPVIPPTTAQITIPAASNWLMTLQLSEG